MFVLFDLINEDLTNLIIEKNKDGNNCIIKNTKTKDQCSGFILYKKQIMIICDVSFHKSSNNKKYIPRLTFRKTDKDENEKYIDNKKPINIEFNNSEKAEQFWKMIAFIQGFKDLVDTGEFDNIYKASKQEEKLNDTKVVNYLKENPLLLKKIVENKIDEIDIVSLGYRKRQLKSFKNMLLNDSLNELDWQHFFEKNNWIFGYGLSYIFHNGLDDKKLEQITSGNDFNSSGKRVDALLKTAGIINSLCFVEIKTHKTKLLKELNSKAYRTSCWSVSDELMGGVAQIQNTVSLNIKKFYGKIQMKNNETRDLTGEELFNFQPKSFLVIGKLDEFKGEFGTNEDKFRSFELFRKNIFNPEIITFDELYERAKYIVDSKDYSDD